MSHTPLPWYGHKESIYWFPEGGTVADGFEQVASLWCPTDERLEANRDLIVKAVNFHDRLMTTLTELTALHDDWGNDQDVIDKARALLIAIRTGATR